MKKLSILLFGCLIIVSGWAQSPISPIEATPAQTQAGQLRYPYVVTPKSLGPALIPTAIKTSGYTLAAGDFVPVDCTSGNVSLVLPNAPATGTRCAAKLIAVSGSYACTITRGGTDVFNKVGGAVSMTLSLLNQAISLQYSSGIWYVVSTDLPLSGMDSRYQATSTVLGSLASPAPSSGQIAIGGTNGLYAPETLSGNVTVSATGVTTIGAGQVTASMAAAAPPYGFLGNATSGTAVPNYSGTAAGVALLTSATAANQRVAMVVDYGRTAPNQISGAGDTALVVPFGASRQAFYVSVAAGSGAYTATCTLSATNAVADTEATVRISLPASKNPTIQLLDNNSVRIGGCIGQSAAHVVTFKCYYNGSAWFVLNRYPAYDTNVMALTANLVLTTDSARVQILTPNADGWKVQLPAAGESIDEPGFRIINRSTSYNALVTDSTGNTTYETILPAGSVNQSIGTTWSWDLTYWFTN